MIYSLSRREIPPTTVLSERFRKSSETKVNNSKKNLSRHTSSEAFWCRNKKLEKMFAARWECVVGRRIISSALLIPSAQFFKLFVSFFAALFHFIRGLFVSFTLAVVTLPFALAAYMPNVVYRDNWLSQLMEVIVCWSFTWFFSGAK